MTAGAAALKVSPGVLLWRGCLDRGAQEELTAEVVGRTKLAPFYRPRMPRSGKSFSVEETNFGTHGWFSDESGYRYETLHPVTKLPWPDIPLSLVALWHAVGNYAAAPECCLLNLYRNGARMASTRIAMKRRSMRLSFPFRLATPPIFASAEFRAAIAQRVSRCTRAM